MLVRSVFLSGVESAMSRFIALDPDAGRFLLPLAGKVIAIRLKNPNLSFYLCPTPNRVQLLEHFEGVADTTLTGSYTAFAAMRLSDRPSASLFSGEVAIEGDIATGRNLQTLFDQLEIDWEEQVARFTGDVIGHQIGNLFRAARGWSEASLETLRLNVSEYLQEESRELPTQVEANIFCRDVDEVRDDSARLTVRIQRLMETSGQLSNNKPDS